MGRLYAWSLHRAAHPPRDCPACAAADNATGDSDQTQGRAARATALQFRTSETVLMNVQRLMRLSPGALPVGTVQACRLLQPDGYSVREKNGDGVKREWKPERGLEEVLKSTR